MTQALDTLSTYPLARFVEKVRLFEPADGRVHRVDRLPDGRTVLAFRALAEGHGDLTVLGPRTIAKLKEARGVTRVVTVQLKVGWASCLLGVPVNDLTDRYVDFADIWGKSGRDLTFELLETSSVSDVMDRLSRGFLRRPMTEPTSASLARRAARLLEEDARVESVADRLGVTARHLRRAFAENIGVSPKEFARGARLARAMRMTTTTTDWSRIAVESGYYDQAHLIAEFHHLVGMTPSAYMTRVRSAP